MIKKPNSKCHPPTERLECWADGSSVQIIAITKSGDPVDCSTDEARDFARKILLAVKDANNQIIMQPVTREYIASFCGIFKTKPGAKPAIQELLEDRAADRAREDRKT